MTSLNLNSTLQYFSEVITSATSRAWHYHKPEREAFPYAIWTEFAEENSLHASNVKKIQPIGILLDYFTQTEFDETIDTIQETLNSADRVAFELTDIQYEEESNVIHYSWTVEVYGESSSSGI